MKKTALITGILGQDGPYLAKLLLEKGYEVYGMIRRHTSINFDNCDYLGITNQIEFVNGDLSDEASLINLIKSLRPEEVYNLAAQSFVGASWNLASSTTEINALGTLNLLNAVKNFSPTSKYYQASTSEMFGNSHSNGLQTKETPFHPRSPYAISKLYAHWMTVNFRESYNMFCTSGILFNHESPIRGLEFVTRKITDGVAQIALGISDHISLGCLDSKRDWGFAGDYAKAMWLMLQQDQPEDFIISTGKTHSIRDFLQKAFSIVGIDDYIKYVKIDPRFKRPAEVFSLHGSSDEARKKLGWEPEIDFDQLVEMMMKADLSRLKKKLALSKDRKHSALAQDHHKEKATYTNG